MSAKEIIIKPQKNLFTLGLKEMWEYRELLYFFVWKDIKVRYKQTVIGVLWAVFKPLMAMFIFTFFFGSFAKMPSDGIPYPVFVYTGLFLWTYFSFSLLQSSESMVVNANILQKIYFPRLIIPISSSLVGLVDFFIAAFILLGVMFYYKFTPSFKGILYMPLLVFITFLSAVGIGSFLAAINVKYRDVRHIVPFFIQMLMFLTPVIYPVSMIGGKYKWIMAINPMSGVIETARVTILGTKPIDWQLMFASIYVSVILFVFGVFYFRKTERFFADVI